MKYILCQSAINQFKWGLEVCLASLKKLGIKDIVLLFSRHDGQIPILFEKEYGVEVYVYDDLRDGKEYIPSIKPYSWWKYLEEDHSRKDDRHFYIDSNIVFDKRINLHKLPSKDDVWYHSDCCSYLSLDYIRSCEGGENTLKDMANIVNVTIESLETVNTNLGGVQWVISRPETNYWKRVHLDPNRLYRYLRGQKTNIQVWITEMWAQLWNMMYFNIGPKVHEELGFYSAIDPIERVKEVKILHNAGVTTNDGDLFFKGRYVTSTPFNKDLSFVNKKKYSYTYVGAIKAVVR